MARADLLIDLVEAERHGDKDRFRSLVEAVIADERAKSHHLVADRLAALLASASTSVRPTIRQNQNGDMPELGGLLHEVMPNRRLCDLTLASHLEASIREFIDEHHRTDLLNSYNLEPRHRILLSGPPGNGKTSLAEAIASEVMLPLYVARYEHIVTSFLGESATRLNQIFEFVRQNRCVLFFDEFDTVAKERSDNHETGEIKRLVSTLLLKIDALPAHVVIIVATNHDELLDRAAWRRFQLRLQLDVPTRALATRFLQKMAFGLGGELGLAPRTLADKLTGASYSDLEQFCLDVRRSYVLRLPDATLSTIAKDKLNQWQTQARNST